MITPTYFIKNVGENQSIDIYFIHFMWDAQILVAKICTAWHREYVNEGEPAKRL